MDEVRTKIVEMVIQLPDNQLNNQLEYLGEMTKLTTLNNTIGEHLGTIMVEDDNLLKRLAQ